MPTGNEALEASIRGAVETGFRRNLLARGQARSLIWRDGQLPDDAPRFTSNLSYDLLSYGYALLGQGIRLLEGGGDASVARIGFERSAEALEAVIARGAAAASRDFHRLVAASAYHLGRFSARAYSLLVAAADNANLSRPERCLALFILRDLDALEAMIAEWRASGQSDDNTLAAALAAHFEGQDESADDEEDGGDGDLLRVVDLALTDQYFGAISVALLAFERGSSELIEDAIKRLSDGLASCAELSMVPQWWCFRLTIHVLRDTWEASFHQRLPLKPLNEVATEEWQRCRRLFIAALYRRRRAEIELWPSQLDAADRAIVGSGNMVVSLPTSAGKTRVAELCILACLADGKKVVFITPLRALSAQTEAVLQRTFAPLGKTVSTLYGSIGVSELDSDFFEDRDIIVGTPEKLDFALRNDPSILYDVGLIVLDEGHMIGLGEREIRYEAQIQRLLQRHDANKRRIVCLSAVLPDGDQLEDFTAWLSNDDDDALVRKNWRPTRLWYGEVVWKNGLGRLNANVEGETPWVETFVGGFVPPKRKKEFPSDQRELCLACAWRLVEDGQTVLIFCPERRSVEPYAEAIVKLHRQLGLPSLYIGDGSDLSTAIAIGTEWLGADHVLLKCLKLGVAIHHGALPTPYRKEIERLLREGVLPVTVSSPTLAQGLNLSASVVIFHDLRRNQEVIRSSDFRNIVGRAGRAYVDVEGLVLYPMFDRVRKRRDDWSGLIASKKGHEMESGLLRLVLALLRRLARKIKAKDFNTLVEYVMNNAEVWDFGHAMVPVGQVTELSEEQWNEYLTTLDTAILSLLGDKEIADVNLEKTLDAVLASSLFERRLARRKEAQHAAFRGLILARAKHLWRNSSARQRRGYFLSGVGLKTGQMLDQHAAALNNLLVQANGGILNDENDAAIGAITAFAAIVFTIDPFIPRQLPNEWPAILRAWLLGEPIASFTADDQDRVLNFVEQGLSFRLPWAMEAVRVRALANNDPVSNGAIGNLTMDDMELGLAVAAVETGTLNRSTALLIRSGFSSRLAAIKIVTDLAATFESGVELRRWLRSRAVREAGNDPDWPMPEAHQLWLDYVSTYSRFAARKWEEITLYSDVRWEVDAVVSEGMAVRLETSEDGSTELLAPDGTRLGVLNERLNPARCGLTIATLEGGRIAISYLGPDTLEATA
ncbi:DEAD/DEAH box helicase [Mesorhizobium temperatum]|uniref:DEAD/DEAH box helicase n=1 Tax=Mesorhizobium temperatum TaxID=241416 RepID=A0A271LB21_9HYPH|nr:DEAD/DEAH box helicase [Mesorhizobium temperatum]PAQ05293.1 DEAD/DEAH box helicase [Mesorhizobium temperatum]